MYGRASTVKTIGARTWAMRITWAIAATSRAAIVTGTSLATRTAITIDACGPIFMDWTILTIPTGFLAAIATPKATPTGVTVTWRLTPAIEMGWERDKRTFMSARTIVRRSMTRTRTRTMVIARALGPRISTRNNIGRDSCAVIRTRLIAENGKSLF